MLMELKQQDLTLGCVAATKSAWMGTSAGVGVRAAEVDNFGHVMLLSTSHTLMLQCPCKNSPNS